MRTRKRIDAVLLRFLALASVVPGLAWADVEPPSSVPESAAPDAPIAAISCEETPLDEMDPATRAALEEAAAAEQPELRPVSLPGGEAKSGVTPQALSLPNDGGSFKGLGESFSPLLSSGTAMFSVL